MAKGDRTYHNERGVSLIEILVVIVVISVVSAMALLQRGSADAQFKRQNVARELKVAFERARFDSVKRRAQGAGPATVIVDATSYTLKTDLNMDGTFQSGESVVTNLAGSNIVMAGLTAMTLPVTVTFNQRGEANAADGSGAVNPQFLVCNASCSSPTNANANIVLVTPTGTVNLLAGNATPPTFANANVTNITPTTGISNTVSLP